MDKISIMAMQLQYRCLIATIQCLANALESGGLTKKEEDDTRKHFSEKVELFDKTCQWLDTYA